MERNERWEYCQEIDVQVDNDEMIDSYDESIDEMIHPMIWNLILDTVLVNEHEADKMEEIVFVVNCYALKQHNFVVHWMVHIDLYQNHMDKRVHSYVNMDSMDLMGMNFVFVIQWV